MAQRPEIVSCIGCTYRELFDAVEDIVYIRDLEGVILDINAAGVRFFGKPKEEIVGRTLHAEPSDERAMSLMETNLSLLESGSDRSTVELHDAQGKGWMFEVRTAVIRDRAGAPAGAFGIMRELKLPGPARARPPVDEHAPTPSETNLFISDPGTPPDGLDTPPSGWMPDAGDAFPRENPRDRRPR